MKKIYHLLATVAVGLTLTSCEKDVADQAPRTDQSTAKALDPARIYHKPTTAAELKLVENLGKVTTVLQELYKNRANVNVVNAAIKSHAYTDQSVLLGDLIYPEKGRVAKAPTFQAYAKSMNLSLQDFSQKFWAVANKLNDPEFTTFLAGVRTGRATANSNIATRGTTTTLTTEGSNEIGEPVSIYFPYSQQFRLDNEQVMPELGEGDGGTPYGPVTNLVTATADADVAWGYQQYVTPSGQYSYQQVMIDDDFVYNNPTHIVGINGIEPYDQVNSPATTNFAPGPPVTLPGAPRSIKQVYVGDVRCTRQFDALVSFTGNGGGSEIRFTRADGFLKFVDGQVQADMYVSGYITITRWHIRNDKFFAYNSEWDGDWETANLNENLAIYEEDNRNQVKITGSVATTVKDKNGNQVVATVGFEKTFKSDDELIRQQNLNQSSFFSLNRIDLEGETFGGWPVRDRSSQVSFTLQDRTFIP